MWNAQTGEQLLELQHADGVVDLAFHPGSKILGTSSKDGTARLWDVDSGSELGRLPFGDGDDSEVREARFSADGRYFAAIGVGGSFCIWDVDRAGIDKCIFTGGVGLAIAFSPDSRLLATASENVAQVWDVEDGSLRFRVEHVDVLKSANMAHFLWIDDVEFSPDSQYLATATEQRAFGMQ